jgi:hypothetical protein
MAALPAGVNDLTRAQVKKAAELTTAAEMARADALNGVPTDMLALVRLEGVAARAIRQLGIKLEPPPAKARGLELARARWAEAEKKAETEARAASSAAQSTEGPPDGRAA